jgi:hypothetical protein
MNHGIDITQTTMQDFYALKNEMWHLEYFSTPICVSNICGKCTWKMQRTCLNTTKWLEGSLSQLTDTHGAIRGGFKAIGTDAAVASKRINALARTAHTRVLKTLIAIWEQGTGTVTHGRPYRLMNTLMTINHWKLKMSLHWKCECYIPKAMNTVHSSLLLATLFT